MSSRTLLTPASGPAWPSTIACCVVGTLICIVPLAGRAIADEKSDQRLLVRVLAEWSARAELAKTVSVAWKESVASAASGTKDKPERRFLWLDLGEGALARFESRNEGERLPGGAGPGQVFSSFNGRRNFQFTSADNAKDWPRGIVWDATFHDEQHALQLRPWLLHFRPFAKPAPDLDKTYLEIVSTTEEIEGRPCVLLEWQDDERPYSGRYWVDVERGCSMVRYIEVFRGKPVAHLNIRHKEHAKLGWVPAKWDAAFNNGQFAINGELLSITLNPELPDSRFELEYPEGTVLFDRDMGRRHRMLSDGRKGEVVP
jgi:hypothetical protein